MKNFKAWMISLMVMVIVMVVCGYACAENDRGEFYPRLTVVIDVVELSNLRYIACQDKDGNIWGFYDDEAEWDVGDIANLLMWNMGEREEDDEIIEVYWEGYTENYNSFWKKLQTP